MGNFWQNAARLIYHLQQRSVYRLNGVRLKRLPWSSIDQRLLGIFLDTTISEEVRFSGLFSYLVSGLLHYSKADYARVYYPGASSNHEAVVDAMEGFCRCLPMISAWISSGRSLTIENLDGHKINLLEIVKKGLLSGTNPESRGFWGKISDCDQRIVEASDIALSIWLLRGHLWPQLTNAERRMISDWLLSVNGKGVPDNNWHLFPIMVNEVLSALGFGGDEILAREHYARLKSFYQGNGWFSDGVGGAHDYYNAWCIHYLLFWLNLINPDLDCDFIDKSLSDFVCNYKFLFSAEGIPITGRSICYRMATPAPLIAAASKGMGCISPGMARRALDCVWRYFLKRGAVHHGRITQGYWEDDLNLLDKYSGPGSSLWSTRSLTVAFHNPPESEFWTAAIEKLPIEKGNYKVFIPEIQWEICGEKRTGDVQIVKIQNSGNMQIEEKELSYFYKFITSALGLPYRREEQYNRNFLEKYRSLRPFWVKQQWEKNNSNEYFENS